MHGLRRLGAVRLVLAAMLGAVILVVVLRNLLMGTPDAVEPSKALFYTPELSRWDNVPPIRP